MKKIVLALFLLLAAVIMMANSASAVTPIHYAPPLTPPAPINNPTTSPS